MKEKILNNNDKYNIVIDNFEGPLDLLIYLITKNKMNIFDISLSDLTDKYIGYLNQMAELSLDIASSFVVMASSLLNIKSKKLLPELVLNDEEEISEENIIARIIEYKKYKKISPKINQIYLSNFGTFQKFMEKIKFENETEYIGESFEKTEMYNLYNEILNRNINKMNIKANEVEKIALYEKITVKDKAKQIVEYLKEKDSFVFSDMFNIEKVNNLEVVTAFLGTLELSKLKQIKLKQSEIFSDIYIIKNNKK